MLLVLKKLLSRLPTPLPVGVTEFNVWSDSIIELSGEYADRTAMKFALASMVLHADSSRGSLPKHYFVVRLRKSAANQVASQVFQDIKLQQQLEAEKKAAEAANQVEAATQPSVVDNGETKKD